MKSPGNPNLSLLNSNFILDDTLCKEGYGHIKSCKSHLFKHAKTHTHTKKKFISAIVTSESSMMSKYHEASV